MKGAAAEMLTDTVSSPSTEADFALENFRVADDDLPEFKDMKFENINELHLDHPGANDPEYRERRDYIASLAKNFRMTGEITDVDYSPREQRVWRYVAEELEELQQKYASPFYLRAKKELRSEERRVGKECRSR